MNKQNEDYFFEGNEISEEKKINIEILTLNKINIK